MTMWEELVSSALMGSERRPLEITADAPDLVQTLDSENAEHRLLMSAAVMALYRRAGYCPTTFTIPAVPPAPAEIRPACSERAVLHLRELLERIPAYNPLLIEWLTIIDSKGKRVPHPYLPALLDWTGLNRKNKVIVTPMAAVMGERGRWLAKQNSRWAFLLEAESKPDDKPAVIKWPETMDPALVDRLNTRTSWSFALVQEFIQWGIQNEAQLPYLRFQVEVVARFERDTLVPARRHLQDYLASTPSHHTWSPYMEAIEFRFKMLEDLSHE
jgi:hypothetical protein